MAARDLRAPSDVLRRQRAAAEKLRRDLLGEVEAHSYFRDFDFTLDGGYICAGFAFTGASGNQDAWLVKLDSLGCDSLGCAAYVGLFEPPQNKEDVDPKGRSDVYGKNKNIFGAWKYGEVYGAPAYFAYTSGGTTSRMGISDKLVQQVFQDGIHKYTGSIGQQHFYNNYNFFNKFGGLDRGLGRFYGYYGFSNPYSNFGTSPSYIPPR